MLLYVVREDTADGSLNYRSFNPTYDQTHQNKYKIKQIVDTEDEALEICTKPLLEYT